MVTAHVRPLTIIVHGPCTFFRPTPFVCRFSINGVGPTLFFWSIFSIRHILHGPSRYHRLGLLDGIVANLEHCAAPPTGEPPWGVTPRQLEKYIRKADALCVKLFDADAKHLLNRHLLQRRRLYLRAIEDGDYRLALSILQDEAKLENLYPSGDGRPGISVNNQVNTAISATEIADIVTRAEAQRNGTPIQAQRNGTPIQNRINELPDGS